MIKCAKCKGCNNRAVFLTNCGHAFHRACIDNMQVRGAKKVCSVCDKTILLTKLRVLDINIDMPNNTQQLLDTIKSLQEEKKADAATIEILQKTNQHNEELIKTFKNNMREHIDTAINNKHIERIALLTMLYEHKKVALELIGNIYRKETGRMLPYQLQLLMESGKHYEKWNLHNNIISEILKKAGEQFYGGNGTTMNAAALQLPTLEAFIRNPSVASSTISQSTTVVSSEGIKEE
mgnify:CR=1